MDISSVNGTSGIVQAMLGSEIKSPGSTADSGNSDMFSALLGSAIDNINTTNSYISDAEDEELRLALGETENTHDLTIALQKASTAIQYTVAIRDRMLDAYNEIMNIQI